MLKADVKRFEDLASADETVRFEAANQLQQLDQFHFHDHPVGKFRFSVEKVASLLCAWHATHRDLIKGWIAQALALTENRSPEVLVLFRDTLKLDGPYMPVVAQLLYTYSTNVPGANELFKLLHRHPNPEVRWRSAMALSCMALAGELDYDKDMSILRTLMLDRHPNTRSDAIRAASRMQGLGLLDYEVLLDVVNTYSGRSRDEARELMVRLERLVAGCTPSAFAPREPLRRTDGVYRVDKAELDSDGVWISSSCLRFLSDGTVHYFGTNVAPVNFPKLRGEIDSKLARGVVNKDGAGITFSLAGGEHALDFEGHIDGDELHLRRTNRRTGERANEIYTWTYVDWNASVAGAPGPTKKSSEKKRDALPFAPLRPQSMRVEDAAKWYVLMLARLPRMLESVSDLAQKIGLGWRIRSEIREAAARAMYDQSRKKDFFAKLPLPLLEELQSLEPAEAMKKLVSVTQAEVQSIPGTLVETTGMQYWDGHQTWVMTEDGWTIKV